jgi:acyl-CoA oxidase
MATTDEDQVRTVQVEVGALRRALDGERAHARNRARELLSHPDFAPVLGLSRDDYRERVLDWARQMAAEGGGSAGYPVRYGGQGDVGGSVAAFETSAMGDLSLLVKCGVQFGLFGGAVLHLGTEKHHERYLRDIGTLALPGCFAMTESGHGSDVQSLETTATYDPDAEEFIVHTPHRQARKDYIGNAARHGRMAAVFAQLVVGGVSQGVHALLVPIRDARGRPLPGVTIEDCGEKIGLNGVDNGRMSFDQVRVPRDALLDRFAQVTTNGRYTSAIENPNRRFFTMLGTLVQGRVSVSGAAVSASKVALAIAIKYGLRRRQFRPPDGGEEALILDYRTHQRRLLPALATTYALHFAQDVLVDDLHAVFTAAESVTEDAELERRKLESDAAGLKSIATWHAVSTIQACREACGGAGYMAVNRFAALKADTDVFTTFEGDNTVLLQLVAKSLLTEYRDQFGDMDPIGMVRFVAEQVIESVMERAAVRRVAQALVDAVPTREDEEALRDRDYHLDLFTWREEHMLNGVARRMKRGVDRGGDPFAVLVQCQDHLVAAARAHVDRIVLERFLDTVDRHQGTDLAAVLDALCDLYALSNIERDRGWFLEHGRISPGRSKMIVRLVNALCDEIRPWAGDLVDAFGIPDQVLAIPLLTDA